MKTVKWITIINTYCPIDGVKTFYGDMIKAKSAEKAQKKADKMGKGYLTVTGDIFVQEVKL